MIHDLAQSTQTTRTNAGVNAALVDAGTVKGAVQAGDTLRGAAQFWSPMKAGQADARPTVAHDPTLGVGPTRGYAGRGGRCDGRLSHGY